MRYGDDVRTTVSLDPDVEAAVEQLRRQDRVGLSEAINVLVRRGMIESPPTRRHTLPSFDLGIRIDVSNIGEVLELMDSDGDARDSVDRT